ncbi:MAG: twin-arginine translocase TatA/TatE family subunit [Sulfolobaceae archaeon]|nr:twin-arginine translocase TatA/TatE family subunit [Sulfolobaceae archaeon]
MFASITDIGIIIVVIILLFFGASKLPEIFRSLGKATGEFKKGQMEAEMELAKMQQSLQQQQVKPLNGQVTTTSREQELENRIKELEKELEELKKQKQQGNQ